NHLQPLPAIAGFENLKVALEGHAVEGTPGRVIVYDQHLHHQLPLLGLSESATGMPRSEVQRSTHLGRRRLDEADAPLTTGLTLRHPNDVVRGRMLAGRWLARREGSSRRAAPDDRAGGVLPVRRPRDRGRQRRGWALLASLAAALRNAVTAHLGIERR